MTTVNEFIEIFQPVEMEDTLNRLNEELKEYPTEFIRRVNGRVLELKFGKDNRYSRVRSCYFDGDIYVVNKKGIIYIAGGMVDSRMLIEFGSRQYPAVAITSVWKN